MLLNKILLCFVQPLNLEVYLSHYEFFDGKIFDRRNVLYALGNDKVENDQPPEAANVLYWFEKVPYLLCWKLGRTLKVCQTVLVVFLIKYASVQFVWKLFFCKKLKSVVPMQIRILTIFAKFSSIQYTFLAKSRIKVPRNTPLHLHETD